MPLNITKRNIPIGKVIPITSTDKTGLQIKSFISRRPYTLIDWQEVVIHSTGNLQSTPQNEANWLMNNPSNNRSASWNYCVNAIEIVEGIPAGEMSYSTGSTIGNKKTVSIEICESGDIRANIIVGAKLTAELLFSKGFGVERVKAHRDYIDKNCPRIIPKGKPWDEFIKLVQNELDLLKPIVEPKVEEINYNKLIKETAKNKEEALNYLMTRQKKVKTKYVNKEMSYTEWNDFLLEQGQLIEFIFEKFDSAFKML